MEGPRQVFIVSVPRSGSTVLTSMLDRVEGVVSVPESLFPQALDMVTPGEFADARLMGAMYVRSALDGSLLSKEEAAECVCGGKGETLVRLGLANARKLGRDPGSVRAVVWKATRMVGRWRLLAGVGGRFLVLRRNMVNVFGSQFRVHFGEHNRNPWRFAVFEGSYEAAYRRYPRDRVFELDYAEIPERLGGVIEWIGVSGRLREGGASSLEGVARGSYWHREVLGEFKNDDAAKRLEVKPADRRALAAGRVLARVGAPLCSLLRDWADRRQMGVLRAWAAEELRAS